MNPDAPTVDALLSVAGATVVLTIILEIAFKAANLAAATKDRFGPLIAALSGVVLVGAAAYYLHADVAQAALTGLFAGFASSGVHDTVSGLGKSTDGG